MSQPKVRPKSRVPNIKISSAFQKHLPSSIPKQKSGNKNPKSKGLLLLNQIDHFISDAFRGEVRQGGLRSCRLQGQRQGAPVPRGQLLEGPAVHQHRGSAEARKTGKEWRETTGVVEILISHRIHGAGKNANIGGILMVNVTIYSIHGSYGYVILLCFIRVIGCIKLHQLSSNILIISQSSNFKVQLGKKNCRKHRNGEVVP